MNFKELVKLNRTCRRYDASKKISRNTLVDLIDDVRYMPSGTNKQALRFALSCDEEINRNIYEGLLWAGYLKDWSGPIEEERPTAYIVIAYEKDYGKPMIEDVGIAAQTIALSARSKGMATCIIKSYKEAIVKDALGLGEDIGLLLVMPIGYPVEEVVVDDIRKGDDIKYYRDSNNVHHVPKILTDDLIIK